MATTRLIDHIRQIPPRATCELIAALADMGLTGPLAPGRITWDGQGILALAPSRAAAAYRYQPPESWRDQSGPASGVYSLGVLAIECLSHQAILPLRDRPEGHDQDVHDRLKPALNGQPGAFPVVAGRIIRSMLSYDPARRPELTRVAERFGALACMAGGQGLSAWLDGLQPSPEPGWSPAVHAGEDAPTMMISEDELRAHLARAASPGSDPQAPIAPPELRSLVQPPRPRVWRLALLALVLGLGVGLWATSQAAATPSDPPASDPLAPDNAPTARADLR